MTKLTLSAALSAFNAETPPSTPQKATLRALFGVTDIATVTPGTGVAAALAKNTGTTGAVALGNQGVGTTNSVTFSTVIASFGFTGTAYKASTGMRTTISTSTYDLDGSSSLSHNGHIVDVTYYLPVTITLQDTVPTDFSCGGEQRGTGQITFAAGAGVTIESFGGLKKTAGQFAQWSLYKTGPGKFSLGGNLA